MSNTNNRPPSASASLFSVVCFLGLLLTGNVAAMDISGMGDMGGMTSTSSIATTVNLQQEAGWLEANQALILLMASAEHCPYCNEMERDYLLPMLRSDDYKEGVRIRKIEMDSLDPILDFDGSEIDPMDFLYRYKAWVAPTLLFLDHEGNVLTKPIVGLGTRDFVSQKIDHSLEEARKAILLR